jgi:hypothetical protein
MSQEGYCRVTLLGEKPISVVGGTPIQAPYLSSELAERLLAQLPERLPGSTILFEYHPKDFFTFSWELHAPVVKRLAQLGARLAFCVNSDHPDVDEFSIQETMVSLRVLTGERDPDELTSRLGALPCNVSYPRESQTGDCVRMQGFWRKGVEVEGYRDLSELWRELFATLPEDGLAVLSEYNVTLGITLTIVYIEGGFSIEADTLAKLAAFNAPLGCWLFPGDDGDEDDEDDEYEDEDNENNEDTND